MGPQCLQGLKMAKNPQVRITAIPIERISGSNDTCPSRHDYLRTKWQSKRRHTFARILRQYIQIHQIHRIRSNLKNKLNTTTKCYLLQNPFYYACSC